MVNFSLPFPELYPIILDAIQPTTRVFLVGGCVRDLILGREPQDIDLALSAEVRKVSRMIANHFDGAVYALDDERETMRVLVEFKESQWKLDIALLRGGNLENDLRTRDFTINAMALELDPSANPNLIDLLGGCQHLQNQVIEACSSTSVIDDPIRILRAERLAIRFGFSISDLTQQQMITAINGIQSISGERQRDEIFKLLILSDVSEGLNHLAELRLFDQLFPLFDADKIDDVGKFQQFIAERPNQQIHEYLRSTLNEDRSILSLICVSLLLNETVDSITECCEYYALSNRERTFLERIRAGLTFVGDVENADQYHPREIYRFFQITGDAGVSVCLIKLALWNHNKNFQSMLPLIDAYFNESKRYMNVVPFLDGNDLIGTFHLKPGPKFRELLESLKEAQVMGIVSNRTEAESFIAGQLK